jgi:hypothetical protein
LLFSLLKNSLILSTSWIKKINKRMAINT